MNCCHACGGVELVYLGALGDTEHYRCRACGMDLSYTPDVSEGFPPSAGDY